MKRVNGKVRKHFFLLEKRNVNIILRMVLVNNDNRIIRNVIKNLKRCTVGEKKTRMSIDISEKDHKKIKIRAAKEGVSIREFVIRCINDKTVDQKQSESKCKKS